MRKPLFGLIFISLTACGPSLHKSFVNSDQYDIHIETTPCFGSCPIYKLDIDEKGNVEYNGARFAGIEGTINIQLDQVEMDSLKSVLIDNRFFDLEEVYDQQGISDLPSTIMVVKIKDKSKSKKVVSRVGAPENLQKIQAYLERLRLRILKQKTLK